jgi:hypothetical protein
MTDLLLTPHFNLKEFEASDIATTYKIDNTIPENLISTVKMFCEEVAEPIRDYLDDGIHINSGYRSLELRKKMSQLGQKTATNSLHNGWWTIEGKNHPCIAVDVTPLSKPIESLWIACKNLMQTQNLRVEEVINEYRWDVEKDSRGLVIEDSRKLVAHWIHIGFVPQPQEPQREIMEVYYIPGGSFGYRLIDRLSPRRRYLHKKVRK